MEVISHRKFGERIGVPTATYPSIYFFGKVTNRKDVSKHAEICKLNHSLRVWKENLGNLRANTSLIPA